MSAQMHSTSSSTWGSPFQPLAASNTNLNFLNRPNLVTWVHLLSTLYHRSSESASAETQHFTFWCWHHGFWELVAEHFHGSTLTWEDMSEEDFVQTPFVVIDVKLDWDDWLYKPDVVTVCLCCCWDMAFWNINQQYQGHTWSLTNHRLDKLIDVDRGSNTMYNDNILVRFKGGS